MGYVLVTGASGGMGAAICTMLLQQGRRVLALDRREGEPQPGLTFLPCDVSDPTSVEAALTQVTAVTGSLDAIVHTAGIYDLDSLLEMDEERFLRIFQVNLFGVYRVNRAFAPLLSPGGRIVIVSSELAPLDPLPFTGIYAITKAALEKYACSLRMEAALLGISVCVVRPGAVNTELLDDSTRALDRFCAKTGLYRVGAARFRRIVDSVEARSVPPEKIAQCVRRALSARRPRLVYPCNRNPLLLLLNALPRRMQLFLIGRILRTPD